jgi:hypothetical protein
MITAAIASTANPARSAPARAITIESPALERSLAADSIRIDSTSVSPARIEPSKIEPAKTEPAKVELAPVTAPTAAPSGKKAKKTRRPKAPKEKRVPHVHTPDAGPWDTGALWVTVRAGYNKATYRTAGDGNFGWGFGATHMLNTGWALSGLTERNVLGKFANSSESEIPFTLELDRHLKWGDVFRPYFGFGGGTYYHKFSKTTADRSEVRGGGFVAIGGNAVVSPHGMIGLDGRVAFVSSRKGQPPVDPVFGVQKQTTTRVSFKVGWSVTY